MPRRALPPLTPERRQALEAELRVLGTLEERAALDKYVYIARAIEAGMSERDVAAVYEVSPHTAHRWKVWGEEERERRRRDNADSG